MISRKQIASSSVAFFAAIAAATAPMNSVAAPTVVPPDKDFAAARLPYKTLNQMYDICLRVDHASMIKNDDFVGLQAWYNYCLLIYNRKSQDPGIIQRMAVANMFLARYKHVYKRNPNAFGINGRTAVFDEERNDPIYHIKLARDFVTVAKERGLNSPKTDELLAQTVAFVNSPVKHKFDPSPGASCMLDALPLEESQLIRKTKVCADAYNARPLGVLALGYGQSLFAYSHHMYEKKIFSTEAQSSAYLSLDFLYRAVEEGFNLGNSAALSRNLIHAYNVRKDNLFAGKVAIGVGMVIFAYPVIVGGSSSAGAAAAGTASTARGAMMASEAAKSAQYLEWLRRADAAMVLVP
jgi:hypothetical protein